MKKRHRSWSEFRKIGMSREVVRQGVLVGAFEGQLTEKGAWVTDGVWRELRIAYDMEAV